MSSALGTVGESPHTRTVTGLAVSITRLTFQRLLTDSTTQSSRPGVGVRLMGPFDGSSFDVSRRCCVSSFLPGGRWDWPLAVAANANVSLSTSRDDTFMVGS